MNIIKVFANPEHQSKIIVIKNDKIVEEKNVYAPQVTSALLELTHLYDITKVNLTGASGFIEKISDDILKEDNFITIHYN